MSHTGQWTIAVIVALMAVYTDAAASPQMIDQSFQSPPDSARAHIWWHWMNGNVSKEGIKKDLEAMKAVGLAGFQLFDVGLGVPQGPLVYNSGKWYEYVTFAIAQAEHLGLEMGIHNASGWSCTGGPWITPKHAMKALVWSRMRITPGAGDLVCLERPNRTDEQRSLNFYRDIAVLAFPTPRAESQGAEPYTIGGWKEKALVNRKAKIEDFIPDLRKAPPDAVVPFNQVLILTDRMDADGKLNWRPSSGDWTVLRVGFTADAVYNNPATSGGVGLECDKLSREALDLHWENLLEKYIACADGKKAFTTILIDSYEAGSQNWTQGFENRFLERCGYDLIPWLVCITGRAVNSVEQTERFLWDFRRTLADLMQQNFFTYFAEKCRSHGLKLAIEPYGAGMFDASTVGMLCDLPMTEFWNDSANETWVWTARVARSSAHLTGRSVVGAEAFTSVGNWTIHPYSMKAQADHYLTQGVNRFYFHTFAHQPWGDHIKPGMTMHMFGMQFHRNNTWFGMASGWLDYLARCQYLMQKGTFLADILVLNGDERGYNNIVQGKTKIEPDDSDGFCFDVGNSDTLDRLSVDANGDIRVTYDGKLLQTRYKVLLLRQAMLMRPERVEQLGLLAQQGAAVFAPIPLRSPGLQHYPESETRLRTLIERYWNSGLIRKPAELEAALAAIGPDCRAPGFIQFNHHRIEDGDYYFISNQTNEPKRVACRFRIAKKMPELWDPETGKIIEAPNWKALNDRYTEVTLDMTEVDSVFVVFRHPTERRGQSTPEPAWQKVLCLNENWDVAFDPQWGPQEPVRFETLVPWNQHPDQAIKYFSGTAVYRTTFDYPKTDKTHQVVLDLGTVCIMARIKLNGKDLGGVWKPPFQTDITDAVRYGRNTLEVEVTNLWPNRLIGDEQYPEMTDRQTDRGNRHYLTAIPEWVQPGQSMPSTERRTFVFCKHWAKNQPLLNSGLLGPVQVLTLCTPDIH